jgi:deazaflavin-dependent oxidoreductase (nitroreductase family)
MSRLVNLTSRAPSLQSLATRAHARLYRRTRGRAGRRWINGAPVLVLETIGRRSGKPRPTPVIYARDGARLVVSAANAGAKRTPAWWLNLRERPAATVELGDRRFPVRARLAEGAERERLWALLRDVAPAIEEYRRFTSREFPVVSLEPVDG